MIDPFMTLDEFVDVSVIHPLRYHCEPAWSQIHTEKWQDVLVSEVPPNDDLSAELLGNVVGMNISP